MDAKTSPELSIIIPVINEAAALPHLLANLTEQAGISFEIILCDGGSSDNSKDLINHSSSLTWLDCPPGRAVQMNAGAEVARGQWLLFLHADCSLPQQDTLRKAVDFLRPDQAGHFGLQFIDRPTPSFRYTLLEVKTRLTKANTTNGDQGLLISRSLFEQVGPFSKQWHFLEDQQIAEALRQDKRLYLLPNYILTSARRFETEGFSARYFLMTLIMVAWSCGLRTFLDKAPESYKEQRDTQKLSIQPFLQLFHQTCRSRPLFKRWKLILDFGCYGKQNLWQPFLWLDVALFGTKRKPLFNAYEKCIFPILCLPLIRTFVDWLIGLSVYILVFWLLKPVLTLRQGSSS